MGPPPNQNKGYKLSCEGIYIYICVCTVSGSCIPLLSGSYIIRVHPRCRSFFTVLNFDILSLAVSDSMQQLSTKLIQRCIGKANGRQCTTMVLGCFTPLVPLNQQRFYSSNLHPLHMMAAPQGGLLPSAARPNWLAPSVTLLISSLHPLPCYLLKLGNLPKA